MAPSFKIHVIRNWAEDAERRLLVDPRLTRLRSRNADAKNAAIMTSVRRFFRDPGKGFFLFGPRGTEKSTWLGEQFEGPIWIDLLDPEHHRRFSSREALRPHCGRATKRKSTTSVGRDYRRRARASEISGSS